MSERAGEDRRGHEEDRRSSNLGPPPGAPERRKPGRPPNRGGRKQTVSRPVKLSLALDAAVARIAARLGITKHAVRVRAIARLAEIESAAVSGRSKIATATNRT